MGAGGGSGNEKPEPVPAEAADILRLVGKPCWHPAECVEQELGERSIAEHLDRRSGRHRHFVRISASRRSAVGPVSHDPVRDIARLVRSSMTRLSSSPSYSYRPSAMRRRASSTPPPVKCRSSESAFLTYPSARGTSPPNIPGVSRSAVVKSRGDCPTRTRHRD